MYGTVKCSSYQLNTSKEEAQIALKQNYNQMVTIPLLFCGERSVL